MEVLVCAATLVEKRACLKGLKDSGFNSQFRVLGTGIGLEQAEKSLSRYLNHENKPDLIVSSGFAGAITGDLPLHSWIVAEQIFSTSGEKASIDLPNFAETIRGSIISLPYLYCRDKIGQLPHFLPGHRLAVDMETAALFKIAACYQIPFLGLRLITDTPTQPLPQLTYRIEKHFQTRGRLHSYLLFLDMLENIPEIIRMYRRMKDGAKLLSAGWKKYPPVILAQL